MSCFALYVTLLVTIFSATTAKSLTSSELPNYGGLKTDHSGMNPEFFDGSTSSVGAHTFVDNVQVFNAASDEVNLQGASPDGFSASLQMIMGTPSKFETVANPMSALVDKN